MSAGRLAQVGFAEALGELEPDSAEGLALGLGSGAEIGAPAYTGPGAGAPAYTGAEVGAVVWRLAGQWLPPAGTCAIRVSPSRSVACPGKPSARTLPSPPESQLPNERSAPSPPPPPACPTQKANSGVAIRMR